MTEFLYYYSEHVEDDFIIIFETDNIEDDIWLSPEALPGFIVRNVITQQALFNMVYEEDVYIRSVT